MRTLSRSDIVIAVGMGIVTATILLLTQPPRWVFYAVGVPVVIAWLLIDSRRHPRQPTRTRREPAASASRR